jgi:Mrp family chromosome partitioning ATPase
MSTFVSLDVDRPVLPEKPRLSEIVGARHPVVARAASRREEQIQALVEQLFFRPEAGPVRYVSFASSGASLETTQLCLDVARALADEGKYDVGLIDASPGEVLLQNQLEVVPAPRPEAAWPIAPRLWLVPRESWLASHEVQRIPEPCFSRLRELTTEFDFAILRCPPVSWLTARIAHASDGLVLVLTANKTRRVVAAHMKELLRQAQVPLLGCALAERRLPVPEALYRQL